LPFGRGEGELFWGPGTQGGARSSLGLGYCRGFPPGLRFGWVVVKSPPLAPRSFFAGKGRVGELWLRDLLSLFDGGGDDVAVFGPTAVVVFHVVEAEQIFEHEPGVAGALADAAIGNGVFLGVHALLLEVNRVEFVGGF